jgi:hypothetical protein
VLSEYTETGDPGVAEARMAGLSEDRVSTKVQISLYLCVVEMALLSQWGTVLVRHNV